MDKLLEHSYVSTFTILKRKYDQQKDREDAMRKRDVESRERDEGVARFSRETDVSLFLLFYCS